MPRLQTLRLWRPDDFPWTSSKSFATRCRIIELRYSSLKPVCSVLVRPNYRERSHTVTIHRWLRSLRTDQSIGM